MGTRLFIPVALMATVAVTIGANDDSGVASVFRAPRAELRAISSRLDKTMSTVLIESSDPVAYVTSQPDPLTVVVDLRDVAAGVLPQTVGPVPPVTGVAVEEAVAPDGMALARVRVSMERPAKYRVRSQRNTIYVEVDRAADPNAGSTTAVRPAGSTPVVPATTTAAAPAPAAAVKEAPALAAATSITGIRPITLPNGVGIAIVGNGQLTPGNVEELKNLPPRLLLDFPQVSMNGVSPLTAVNQGDVQRVRVAHNSVSPLITRVVIDLAKRIAYRVEQAGEELRVLFEREPVAAAPQAAAAVPVETAPPAPNVSTPAPAEQVTATVVSAAPAGGPEPGAVVVPEPMAAQQPATVMPTVVVEQPPATAQPRFTGHTVSLDFQGADLRSVLRTFAEISGLNMVIDPSIQGTVDVSLRDVPWDQALDIILRANKLSYAIDGTIVRIAPVATLAQEQEERRKLTEAQSLAGDLRVITVPLSYAKAQEMVALLTRSALSSRGEVQVDSRTNTLIVKDLPGRLDTVSELIKTLDRPQPQVEIEARIIQTNRDFARALGVQWGINGRVDPALGTSTGLAFPSDGSLTGRTGGVQGPTQGTSSADRAVNLPTTIGAATSAIGIALGSINGALNLDVVLSQLERTGNGRILSTPRVTTQNNIEAEMTQGTQIPYQTVANNTITTNFKDAALILRVTPQITASNTVILRINLENATANFANAIGGVPPIDTQRAITTVLVADGETTVIGGIYISREQATQGRVPLLHRIPLLGWLFKRDEITDESRELLIFITPRITRS